MIMPRFRKEGGFAMLAAIIILSLLIVLGLMAFMVSESEIRVVTNIDMAKKLYFIAEQAVDRILMHLHYNPEGPIKLLGIDMYSNPGNGDRVVILPRQIFRGVGPLAIDRASEASAPIKVDDNYTIEAAVNYRDWFRDTGNGEVARPIDQPFKILVKVKHKGSQFTKAYVVDVKPKTPYNFAYYNQNSGLIPDSTWPSYNSNPVFRQRGRAASVTFTDTYGYCQSMPSFFDNRVIGDLITGDVYLGGYDSRFLVRGGPAFAGSIWWRTLYPYYDPSLSQSSGCQGCDKHPYIAGGIRSYSPEIGMFEDNAQDSFWFSSIGTGTDNLFGVQGIKEAANYRFTNDYISGAGHYVPRILFMHNVNVDGDNECEERVNPLTCANVEARVGSAITPRLNNGRVEDPDDRGVMIVWRVRWDHPTAINADHTPTYAAADFASSNWYRAALSGDNLGHRMQVMLDADGTANPCVFDGSSRSCGTLGCTIPDARRLTVKYSGTDLYVRPAMVPDFGKTCTELGGQGSFPYNGDRATGIIFVDGDVLVSGVLDGRVSIYATGDIILDHEIEYEKDPLKYANDPVDADMLGLFARGDIIIPEHAGSEYPGLPTNTFPDDWSDPLLGDGNFAPQGWFDSNDPYTGSYVAGPLLDDDGSEDLHAIIQAAGYECKYDSGVPDCREWTDQTLIDRKLQARKDMRVGFYAMPKTVGIKSGSTWAAGFGDPQGRPFLRLAGTNYRFHNMANQSGPLRIVGAIMQEYPGRVGYDYDVGTSMIWNGKQAVVDSTCTNGTSSLVYTCTQDASDLNRYYWAEDFSSPNYKPCNTVGHESFELTWDPRLRLIHPPMPYDIAYSTAPSANHIPNGAWWFGYGMAAYEILSWKEIPSDTNFADNTAANSGNPF